MQRLSSLVTLGFVVTAFFCGAVEAKNNKNKSHGEWIELSSKLYQKNLQIESS